MNSVEVRREGTAELINVQIDGAPLAFSADGVATRDVVAGHEYVIQWFIRGTPGTTYKVQVTQPAEARFVASATLNDSQKDAGVFWFTIKGEHA
jgi:hypothetical protein